MDDGREVWISGSGSTMHMTADGARTYDSFPPPAEDDEVIIGGLAIVPIACYENCI